MKIGIVLSSTPSYSETFFISKIKGLQKHGFEVVLFVNQTNNGFNLCKVKLNTIESKNIIYILLNFIKACLFNFRVVSNFYKLEKISNRSKKLIIKKIILNLHIINEKKIDWLHFGFATQAIGRENIAKAVGAKMAVSLRGFDIGIYPLKNPKCYDLLWLNINKLHVISIRYFF